MFGWLKHKPQVEAPRPLLVCPNCEREMDERHEADGCARGLSRRFFFGIVAGAAASVIVAEALPVSGIAISRGNQYLTIEQITAEMLEVLRDRMERDPLRMMNRQYDHYFSTGSKIGDTITVRTPPHFVRHFGEPFQFR